MIFVGEHASITHSWIASALESGIRGGVQLLLGKDYPVTVQSWAHIGTNLVCIELGLVDEAKEVVDKWLARWISVVSEQVDLLLDKGNAY